MFRIIKKYRNKLKEKKKQPHNRSLTDSKQPRDEMSNQSTSGISNSRVNSEIKSLVNKRHIISIYLFNLLLTSFNIIPKICF